MFMVVFFFKARNLLYTLLMIYLCMGYIQNDNLIGAQSGEGLSGSTVAAKSRNLLSHSHYQIIKMSTPYLIMRSYCISMFITHTLLRKENHP